MRLLKFVLGLFGVTALVACSESSSMMTGPSNMDASRQGSPPSVNNAAVLVGGEPVQGKVSQGNGEQALFRVQVSAPRGLSTVRRVVMEYSQPGPNHYGGPMRGGYQGTVLCYDDGTHGDPIPGDGIYHYMDPQNQIGCHGYDAPHGEYHYQFWCEDIYGQRSNTLSIRIVRE